MRAGRAVKPKEPCHHCRAAPIARSYGLCAGCFATPETRKRHAPKRKINPVGERPPPPEPTGAEPGSPEKIAVLIWRAEMGFALWHEDDERFITTPLPDAA